MKHIWSKRQKVDRAECVGWLKVVD